METQYLKIAQGKPVLPDGLKTSGSVQKARLDQQTRVVNMGLSPEVISLIVDEFYIRVRRHPVLAPHFKQAVGDDWSGHLEKMKSFWLSVALNAGTYSGKPVEVHKRLPEIPQALFSIWLQLFAETVRDITASDDATDFLVGRATKIARSLSNALYGKPAPSIETLG